MSEERHKLGRGLAALLGEAAAPKRDAADPAARPDRHVALGRLHPGRFQPRRHFDKEGLETLAQSIKAQGILQPILVRPHPTFPQDYEIVAGERRWRAAQIALLHEVPVVLREFSDAETLEIALVENVQRQDLSPIEEAEAYRRLLEEFRHTQDDLARVIGKSRSHVANTLRLLALPAEVRQLVEEGRLSAGHARALLTAKDAASLAAEVMARGLNVRQTERLAKRASFKKTSARHQGRDADHDALERDLAAALGLKVTLTPGAVGGTLTIHYRTLEQLDQVLARLGLDAE
ncbi:MAG TPA: ParB/RepB/Spo0J family partition protein [Stellaceae bacterium]|nr:ParB/RepB/Spo0J family partition protein [Stellaceae bacterium]